MPAIEDRVQLKARQNDSALNAQRAQLYTVQ